MQGLGKFIILPDLPQNDDSALPTLCYRRSEGLLLRVSEFNRGEIEVYESVELLDLKSTRLNSSHAQ